LRRVGREMPHRRQTRPASLASAYSRTQVSRAAISRSEFVIQPSYDAETILVIPTFRHGEEAKRIPRKNIKRLLHHLCPLGHNLGYM
jgi:hypothetical protein